MDQDMTGGVALLAGVFTRDLLQVLVDWDPMAIGGIATNDILSQRPTTCAMRG